MKTKNILVSVCGLAALFCSCTKNEPEKGPEKTPVAVEEVKLDATARVQRGGQCQLTATVLPEDATYDAVAWKSDDETVATVDGKGLVTGVGLGTTKITASVGEKSAECEVTVYVAATGVTLDKTELELSLGGTSVKLVATVEPWNVSESEKTVTWSSANPEIATVDGEGTVSPVAEGETTVTAKCADFTAECKVTVKKHARVWAIGDYYEVDGVKGVVCWVSDDSQHGKIVSLDETGYVVWSTEETTTGATSETNGKENTEKIKDSNPSLRGYETSFKWCLDHGDGWYFPACDEVEAFMANRTVINPTLEQNGGAKIQNDYYWTSTEAEGEDGEIHAFQTSLKSDGTPTTAGEFKADNEYTAHVRAMYEF